MTDRPLPPAMPMVYHATADPEVFFEGYANSVSGQWEFPDWLVVEGELFHRSQVKVEDDDE